ncbi:MAG: hypothetical protein DF168_00801 [Candidatus Moanabacter tarae]|uniref:Nucleotide pyrophosphohydrolase n=1 Tax=Candidatus Moanibacter tarae TaxID=2200854 RepID=A0A2Z4AC23_9BACT|nr:MAG: hypothetical protein DF168_00801 [Candidatus Moanabacter tarae]
MKKEILGLRLIQNSKNHLIDKMTLAKITEEIRKFRDERDWMQFHNAKDMAIAITIEASELAEQFLWKSQVEIEKKIKDDPDSITDEIADVGIYLFELADNLGIDIIEAMHAKLKKNAIKYPILKSKGSNLKYTDLD